ncbi:MAG: ParB/RepB/Spo0J family partition protein [Patescibacteria group bacterium]|jgi:ParB family chromosome partitioning protein|nr:ParB/RepB/Spo0J family partition protein [Patescibacteria group bacterium]
MPQGLGRGLGSLIPKKTVTYGKNPYDSDSKNEEVVVHDFDRILKVKQSEISVNPQQPRQEFSENALNDLANSIKEHGIISPLIVTPKEEGYELIAGERRLRASKIAGLKEVPVIVREEREQEKLELALIENLQRENLNPLESALAYQKLMNEFNLTQDETAIKLGKARSTIANALRLLSLSTEAQSALAAGKISEAHAKYLLSIENEAKQVNMLKKILRHNLTVLETGKEIKRLNRSPEIKEKDLHDKNKEDELSSYLSSKVEIKRKKKGGQIIIDFFADEDLNDILTKIKN